MLERLLEDPTDRTGLAPVTAVEPSSLELAFLAKKGVALRVLEQAIDTSASTGSVMFNMLGAIVMLKVGRANST